MLDTPVEFKRFRQFLRQISGAFLSLSTDIVTPSGYGDMLWQRLAALDIIMSTSQCRSQVAVTLSFILLLQACGGGSSGGGDNNPPPPPVAATIALSRVFSDISFSGLASHFPAW